MMDASPLSEYGVAYSMLCGDESFNEIMENAPWMDELVKKVDQELPAKVKPRSL